MKSDFEKLTRLLFCDLVTYISDQNKLTKPFEADLKFDKLTLISFFFLNFKELFLDLNKRCYSKQMHVSSIFIMSQPDDPFVGNSRHDWRIHSYK